MVDNVFCCCFLVFFLCFWKDWGGKQGRCLGSSHCKSVLAFGSYKFSSLTCSPLSSSIFWKNLSIFFFTFKSLQLIFRLCENRNENNRARISNWSLRKKMDHTGNDNEWHEWLLFLGFQFLFEWVSEIQCWTHSDGSQKNIKS